MNVLISICILKISNVFIRIINFTNFKIDSYIHIYISYLRKERIKKKKKRKIIIIKKNRIFNIQIRTAVDTR